MAYDESLAERIRDNFPGKAGVDERKMFGGVAYFVNGNLACGVNKDSLIVRVGPDAYEAALAEDRVSEFDITGRPMTGWVSVAPENVSEDTDLAGWIQRGIDFAASLPPK